MAHNAHTADEAEGITTPSTPTSGIVQEADYQDQGEREDDRKDKSCKNEGKRLKFSSRSRVQIKFSCGGAPNSESTKHTVEAQIFYHSACNVEDDGFVVVQVQMKTSMQYRFVDRE